MLKQRFVEYSTVNLIMTVAASRDERLKRVNKETIIHQLNISSGIISLTSKDHNLPTTNSCALIRKSQRHKRRMFLLNVPTEKNH